MNIPVLLIPLRASSLLRQKLIHLERRHTAIFLLLNQVLIADFIRLSRSVKYCTYVGYYVSFVRNKMTQLLIEFCSSTVVRTITSASDAPRLIIICH